MRFTQKLVRSAGELGIRTRDSTVGALAPAHLAWASANAGRASPDVGLVARRPAFSGTNRKGLGSFLAGLLIAAGGVGCSLAPEAPVLATAWREAEIAVMNLTPYSWRIAWQTPEGANVKTVTVQPRETFAVVVNGGEYVVTQVLVDPAVTTGETRSFQARFEPGERYRWSLATLLAVEGPALP